MNAEPLLSYRAATSPVTPSTRRCEARDWPIAGSHGCPTPHGGIAVFDAGLSLFDVHKRLGHYSPAMIAELYTHT